jgi:hypothetical protein
MPSGGFAGGKGWRMIVSSSFTYNWVNIVLAMVCVIAIALAFKFVPDKRSRGTLIGGLILIVLTSAILIVSLKIFRLHGTVGLGEAIGKVEGGTYAMVRRFRDIALLGNVCEFIAFCLFAGTARRLLSLRTRGQSEGGAEQ